MMSDPTKPLKALCWFKNPDRSPANFGNGTISGRAFTAASHSADVADINGDGHLDIVRGDTWYENKDGKGLEWIAHKNIPMGRNGPFGMCVQTIVADMDGNGKAIVMSPTPAIGDSKIVILRTPGRQRGAMDQAGTAAELQIRVLAFARRGRFPP